MVFYERTQNVTKSDILLAAALHMQYPICAHRARPQVRAILLNSSHQLATAITVQGAFSVIAISDHTQVCCAGRAGFSPFDTSG